MNTRSFFLSQILHPVLVACAALSPLMSVNAANPPPCDPCKIEQAPSASPSHLKGEVGDPVKIGISGWRIPVTWTTTQNPQGAYIPECDNINQQGLQAFDGWYVPGSMTKNFVLNTGASRFAQSDNFYARYFDPCEGGPYKDGGTAYGLEEIKAPKGDTPDPDPDDPGSGDPGSGGSDTGGGDPSGGEPIGSDPYERPGDPDEPEDPCDEEFVPGKFQPFDYPDTRTKVTLSAPTQVQIVAENIRFNHRKNGILQYNYYLVRPPVPKYFLQEDATTSLTGGSPESPVGGSVTRCIHPMTGEIIETAKTGNPSYYGARSGANVTLTETTASGSIDVTSYDDCPNEEHDEPGVLVFESTLSDEYTKERMRDDAFHYAWEFKGEGYFERKSASAWLLISDNEKWINYQKTSYKIRVPDALPRPYTAVWVEKFAPEDSGQASEGEYTVKSEEIGGRESSVYVIDPAESPEKEGIWEVVLLPVEFLTPAGDPVSAPVEAGNDSANVPDGANEFTFSDDAIGVLTMKLKVKVGGIGAMPAAEKARFKFELDSIGNSTFAWDAANPGGKATVSGDFITATATYTGLPQHNSDFGLKKARVKYGSHNVGEAEFEVFFSRDATNHPGGQADSANWFHYWKEGGVCGIPADAIYDDDPAHSEWLGYTMPEVDSIVRLCPAAPVGSPEGASPVTLTSAILKPESNPPTTFGTLTLGSDAKGIGSVAATISHELYHITIYSDLAGKIDDDPHLAGGGVGDGVADSSEGNLADIESSHLHCDTYGLSGLANEYAIYADFADEEIRCMKQETNISFPVLPAKDWANPGCQSANQNGPLP